MASRPIAPPPRPLSPHLTIWKWRVHMAVSIVHRVTGHALAFGAVVIFAWWLAALASGPTYYRLFQDLVLNRFLKMGKISKGRLMESVINLKK